jgi:hypothetical protein
MTCTYKAMEIGGSAKDGRPRYRNTRNPQEPGDPPFAFCDHQHETLAEAANCRDFGTPHDQDA